MTSPFYKFYKKSREERLAILLKEHYLTPNDYDLFLNNKLLDDDVANALIENQLTQFPLPMGVAMNFIIDGEKKVIPMVVEEPSVIAACSHAAKMTLPDGITTKVHSRQIIGQIILKDVVDHEEASQMIDSHFREIKEIADNTHPSIVARGGGLKKIRTRSISDTSEQNFFTIHLFVDVQNAMGANIINTILEGVTPFVLELIQGASLMSILSNYNTDCLVSASCKVPFLQLAPSVEQGKLIAEKIAEASLYAKLDPYRAVTHNKGIMNGIDSVVIATGNDPRAVSAASHAYASRHGQYEGMTNWYVVEDHLIGELTLPMAVGSVGGAISVLPMAKANLDLLEVRDATDLARIILSVGLAQNLAALKALVSVGIQKGHMSLHASSLAIQVGAKGEEIEEVTKALRRAPKMNTQIAKHILNKLREK